MSIAAISTSILKRDAFLYVTKIFTSIIIARKLGPEAFGVFVILSLIPSYAESFGRLKFDIAAVYFLGKNKYSMREVILTLNLLALLTSGLIVGIILLQFDWIFRLLFSNSTYAETSLMHFVLLQIPLHFLFMNYSYLMIHKEDVSTYNHMLIIQALVTSVLPAILLLVSDMGLWAVAGSMILGTFLSLLYGIIKLRVTGSAGNLVNMLLIRDLFQYGSKLYAGGLVGHLQAYITNLLTALYLVPAQVAFFSMARGLGQMIDRVPASLNTILFPRLTKITERDEASHLTARAFRVIFVLMVVFGLIALVLILPAVYLMYGRAYLPVVIPFIILIPGIILSGATTPIFQYFMSIDRADFGVTIPIVPLALQIGLAILLIPSWGPEGAAIAFSASLATMSFISVLMFLRVSKCTFLADLMIRPNDIYYLVEFARIEARKLLKLKNPI